MTVDVGAVVTAFGGVLTAAAAIVAARANRDAHTDERLRRERDAARTDADAWRTYARQLVALVAGHNRNVARSGLSCELIDVPTEPATTDVGAH